MRQHEVAKPIVTAHGTGNDVRNLAAPSVGSVSRSQPCLATERAAATLLNTEDHPVDGGELYFTELTIQGRSLKDGTPTTVAVTYNGGFISESEGVFNSEAPARDDVKLGNKIVAFYVWSDNLGGDVAANALVAAHGGLYRTVDGPRGTAILGRGEGYALRSNVRMSELESSLEFLYKAKR